MAAIPPERDRALVLAMLDLKRAARGPVGGPIGDWLVARAKKMWPRFAGLRGPTRTNMRGRFNLIAYHHPAQLCWEWFWSLSFNRQDVRWRHPRHWISLSGFSKRFGRAWVVIPFLFEISFTRQDYGYMLSSAAEQKLRAYAFEAEDQPHVTP